MWVCKYLFETLLSIISDLLDHMVTLFLIFLRKSHIIFQSNCTILIFHSHQKCTGFQFLLILGNICYFIFYISHPNRCEVVYHEGFDLYFPSD